MENEKLKEENVRLRQALEQIAHGLFYGDIKEYSYRMREIALQALKDDKQDTRIESNIHYHTGNIDVWKFADENFSLEERNGFHRMNAIKYLTRFGKKSGYNLRDLDKVIDAVNKLKELHSCRKTDSY